MHAVYQYHHDDISLDAVVAEAPRLEGGGTLAVMLGSHALKRGYEATIYTYNLQVFDPTWFSPGAPPLASKLLAMSQNRIDRKLGSATRAYVEYLALGGKIRFEDLTAELLRKYLKRGMPVLTGLSSTFLYRAAREIPGSSEADDVRGVPAGHFVVLSGYRETTREVRVNDPWHPNPVSKGGTYWVTMSRLVNSILLGILTYDANLLIIEKKTDGKGPSRGRQKDDSRANPRRRQ
ncbi:MAG TPA: C39 family peptidase [Polyangiaceae bacterium]|nr:C39 family peptidase [Polyangiaceae bacterium]